MTKDLNKDLGLPLNVEGYELRDGMLDSGVVSDVIDSPVLDSVIDYRNDFHGYLNRVSKDINTRSDVYSGLDLVDVDKIPSEVFRLHGCIGCDWKGTIDCPYRKSKEFGNISICEKRRFYLWYMTRDMKLYKSGTGVRSQWSLAQWTEGYMKNRMQLDLNTRFLQLERAIKKLDELEEEIVVSFGKDSRVDYNDMSDVTSNDLQQLEYLNNRRKELRHEYDDLMKFIVKSEQIEIDRELPKDINLNVRNSVSIKDFNRIVSGIDDDKIVDAEYDMIDEAELDGS